MSRAGVPQIALMFALLLATPAALGGDATYGEPPPDAPEAEVLWSADHVVAVKFAPDGTAVFGTLGGEVYRWDVHDEDPDRIGEVPAVTGPEWGLTDVAIPPDFGDTGAVLVAYTSGNGGVDPGSDDVEGTLSVVVLHPDGGEEVIFTYPAMRSHNGGRLLVHDGLLFVATGDRKQEDRVKEPDNHVGKILRMTLDGEPAPDNPNLDGWDPYVYSMGHRNPFGLAWDEGRDRLVESEPGQYEREEINAIEPGKHYGWPHCAGPCEPPEDGYTDPLVHYPKVITPVGVAVVGADYYVGGYNTGEIRRAYEGPDGWTDEVVFKHSQGILDVEAGPEKEWIYYGTWNGLWRFPTPEVSLETVDEGGDDDVNDSGTDVTPEGPGDGGLNAGFEGPDDPPADSEGTPGAPVAALLVAIVSVAVAGRSRRNVGR